MSTQPDTIVLVHGLWVTPRSWEQWVQRFEERGYRVLTPAYPGFEVEVEALRADPSPIADCDITETIDHLADVVRSVENPPIIMGHSFGGTLTQMLLHRGLGAAGVVINSAPTEGVRVTPPSQVKSLFPALNNPANHHKAVEFTEKQFHYAFTNTLDEAAAKAAYDRYAIGAPGRWIWDYGLLANFKPGKQETWVDYDNDDRAPLLFIAGGEDHIMPPAVNRSNHRKYRKSKALTDFHLFEGRSHWTCAEPGWEDVADYALEWALEHARPTSDVSPDTV
ncbi:alpha/beta hydrolase [Aeromicrobium choanae]|uniref:Pimeloyl-ACP methyl ester carboxylesterase n=1 Tax=Aeromicrobium choanae TaxID=1736691 RepID=A0A1T4Z8D9_9ACTN|nr:alpha/beta hydrolase [Aeromicrobium choanae]SKB09871.1 Pimeloyl-ACP methyl ester carboxylesterase [Aeromicrobium choanae]